MTRKGEKVKRKRNKQHPSLNTKNTKTPKTKQTQRKISDFYFCALLFRIFISRSRSIVPQQYTFFFGRTKKTHSILFIIIIIIIILVMNTKSISIFVQCSLNKFHIATICFVKSLFLTYYFTSR